MKGVKTELNLPVCVSQRRRGDGGRMERTDNGPQILIENAPQAKRGSMGHGEDGGEKCV